MKCDLFRTEDMQLITEKVEKIEKSTAQVRRGLFARHTALEKYMTELRDKLEEQSKEIHKLKSTLYDDEKTHLEIIK